MSPKDGMAQWRAWLEEKSAFTPSPASPQETRELGDIAPLESEEYVSALDSFAEKEEKQAPSEAAEKEGERVFWGEMRRRPYWR